MIRFRGDASSVSGCRSWSRTEEADRLVAHRCAVRPSPRGRAGDLLYVDGVDFNVASTTVGIRPLMDQDAAHLRDLAGVQRRGGFGNDAS